MLKGFSRWILDDEITKAQRYYDGLHKKSEELSANAKVIETENVRLKSIIENLTKEITRLERMDLKVDSPGDTPDTKCESVDAKVDSSGDTKDRKSSVPLKPELVAPRATPELIVHPIQTNGNKYDKAHRSSRDEAHQGPQDIYSGSKRK